MSVQADCFGFEGGDNSSADALAADARCDVHPFDFGDAGFDQSDGTAADRLAVEVGDEEAAAAFGNFLGI